MLLLTILSGTKARTPRDASDLDSLPVTLLVGRIFKKRRRFIIREDTLCPIGLLMFVYDCSYISPFKDTEVDDEGIFRLKWWAQNEIMKGDPMPMTTAADSPFTAVVADMAQGVMMEATFVLPASPIPADWPGFILQKQGTY